jgi:hypothetical protein
MRPQTVWVGDLARVEGVSYSRCLWDIGGIYGCPSAPPFERDELVIVLGRCEHKGKTWAKVFTRLGVYYINDVALVLA